MFNFENQYNRILEVKNNYLDRSSIPMLHTLIFCMITLKKGIFNNKISSRS